MRVAILGGTGSIGMAVARRLASRGEQVTVLSRRRPDALSHDLPWHRADVTDPFSVQKALGEIAAERVVHLAALLQFACERDPVEALRVNVDGTLHVLEACDELGIERVVFGSSIAVYGARSDLMHETDAVPDDVSFYGITKRMGEALGEQFRRAGMEFVALRYSGVIGPGEAASAGMAGVRAQILRCASGEGVTIDGASGDEHVHLTHVDDAVEATCVALIAPAPAHSIYNVAGPAENYVTLRRLHELVCEMAPGAGGVTWTGRARSAGPVDTSRIAEDLGWRPAIALRDGLRELLAAQRHASIA